MKGEVVLQVKNLNKVFKIYPSSAGRIKEWLTFGKRLFHKKFHALKDISFEVRRGEFLGIIGPNGAGKSTLLKVITGALDATSGSYEISGRVLSLIELSGGMDADLTGRENIIRSTKLLGLPSGYAESKMEQIEKFAELGDFFDRPLGIYSSGMRIRLAFSMFAFFDCDVLILDEVLAVGDIFFRQKCYARLDEIIKQNTAIIFVTHSTGTVSRYCENVIVMQNGSIYYYGSPDVAIQKYFEIKEDQGIKIKISDTYLEEDYVSNTGGGAKTHPNNKDWPSQEEFSSAALPEKNENKNAALVQLLVCNKDRAPCLLFKQGEVAYFYYTFLAKTDFGVPVAGIDLLTVTNLIVHGRNSMQYRVDHPVRVSSGNIIRYKQAVKMDLMPGRYVYNISLVAFHPSDYDNVDMLSSLEIKDKQTTIINVKPAGVIQVTSVAKKGGKMHSGMCNLGGSMSVQLID